jgi:hypothetical protein
VKGENRETHSKSIRFGMGSASTAEELCLGESTCSQRTKSGGRATDEILVSKRNSLAKRSSSMRSCLRSELCSYCIPDENDLFLKSAKQQHKTRFAKRLGFSSEVIGSWSVQIERGDNPTSYDRAVTIGDLGMTPTITPQ